MTDDKLMKELGEAARRRRDTMPGARWDALAAGELSDEERAALLATDPDGALAELFEPLGDDFENAVLGELLGDSPAPAAEPGPQPATATPREPAPALAPPEAVPEPANRPLWVLWAVPVLAVAAALLLFFAVPSGGPAMPDYAWEISGGDQIVRSGDPVADGPRALTPGSALEIVARPATPVTEPVSATVFVRRVDGSLVASAVPAQVAESGSARWVGRAGDGVLQPGITEVVLVVHPVDASTAEVAAAARSGSLPRTVVQVSVSLVP